MGVYPLDPVRPWLSSGGTVIAWGAGGPAYLVASSTVVRVNFRGVYTRPPGAKLRGLSDLGWLGAPCNLSGTSLCRYAWGDAFPVGAPLVTDTSSSLPSAWAALGCSNGLGKTVTSGPVYDLSACDVLDQVCVLGFRLACFSGMIHVCSGSRVATWCTRTGRCTT